jgi:hypothetical protein
MVTVTDVNNCSSSDTASVYIIYVNADAGNDPTSCANDMVTLTASGGDSYLWSNGGTLASINVSPSTTQKYYVTVTGTDLCTSVDSVTVYVNPLPSANAGNDTTICLNDYAMLHATGGMNYSWSNIWGGQNNMVFPLVQTKYYVTVTDENSCSAIDSVTVSVNSLPTANAGSNATICRYGTTTLSATGGISYSWSNGATTQSTAVSPINTSPFIVTVTDINSCKNSDTVLVNVNFITPNAGTDIAFCQGGSDTITASGGISYVWNTTATTPSIIVSTAGLYIVTVTGANGCIAPDSVVVTTYTVPSTTSAISGSVSVCENSLTTYSVTNDLNFSGYIWTLPIGWTGTSSTHSIDVTTGSTGGTITVTPINSCGLGTSESLVVNVNLNPIVTATGTASICEGSSTPLLASGAVSFSWSPATGLTDTSIANPNAAPLTTTTYTVTGTTGNCSSTSTVTIIVNPLPVIVISGSTNICEGGSTVLTASGATSYSWVPSTGLSDVSIENPTANPINSTSYTITGTTGTCSNSTNFTLTVSTAINVVAGGTATICQGSTAQLSASGGTTYSWSPSTDLNNATITNPVATPALTTTYTVTGTSGGCSSTASVTITVNSLPLVNAGSDATICSGDGVLLNATGGTSYTWSPSTGLNATNIANPIASPVNTTVYTVTASNGTCSATDNVLVTVTPVPSANAGSDVTISCGGTATLGASGGITYSWSPSVGLSATNIANPVATSPYTITYSVLVFDGTCSATDAVTVTVGNMVAHAGNDTTICIGSNVNLNGTSTGGTTSVLDWISARKFGSTNIDAGGGVAVDAAGNHYITGRFQGTVTFGTISLTAANYDVYVVKIDPSGTVLWAQKGGGSSLDWGYGIAVDPTGNVYVSGLFYSTATFGTYNITSLGSGDVFVAKYNSSGVCQWAAAGGNPGNDDMGYGIAADASGCWVTGYYRGTGTFGSTVLTAIGGTFDTDIFIARYSPSGVLKWAKTAGSASTDNANSLSIDNAGNAYIGGFIQNTATFGTVTVTTAGGSQDAFIAKIDSSGSFLWAKSGGQSAYSENVGAVTTDAAGNSYLVGTMQVTATFSPFTLSGIGAVDVFLVKYNSAGTVQWARNYGGSANEAVYAACISPVTGNIFIAGTSLSPSVIIGSTTLSSFGSSGQTMVAEYTPNGNPVSAIKSGSPSPGGDIPWGIASDVNGVTYVTGKFAVANTAVFGSTTLTSAGNNDAFEAKLGYTSTTPTYSWSPATGLNATNISNPVATPAVTTTYTLIVTGDSCTAMDQITITVLDSSSVSAGMDTSICPGGSTILQATGGGSYFWSPSAGLSATNIANPSASPANTTNYVVTVSNGICTFTDSVLVTVNPLLSAPVFISGANEICSGGSGLYEINPLAGATSYTWSLPIGWTGTSTNTSISTIANSTDGIISVFANNICGAGASSSLNVNILPVPVQPTLIYGSATVCQGSVNIYSATVNGATSYTWTLPNGWTGSSNTDSIPVTAGISGGNISVIASNFCGSSAMQILPVSVNTVPQSPVAIDGNTVLCSTTTDVYSITPVVDATSYSWTLPADWTGSSNTDMIIVTAGTISGNIQVTANNICGASSPQTLAIAINTVPATPTAINGNTGLCLVLTSVYSVDSIPGATSYTWIIPNGWTGSSFVDSIQITSDGTSGTISVAANNSCGSSLTQSLLVTIDSPVGSIGLISGNISVCENSQNTYSVSSVSNASSYTWILPNGWSGNSTTENISAIAGTTGGTISVTANNACGSTSPQLLTIAVNALPVVALDLAPIDTQCVTVSSVLISGGSPSGGTYSGAFVTGNDFSPSSAGLGTYPISYSYTDGSGCSNSATSNILVDICSGVNTGELSNCNLNIYPNPFTSGITIVAEGNEVQDIEIMNVLGEIVYASHLHNKIANIDLSHLKNAVYFVVINKEKNNHPKMIIKQ